MMLQSFFPLGLPSSLMIYMSTHDIPPNVLHMLYTIPRPLLIHLLILYLVN